MDLFLFFDLQQLFAFYCLWFKAFGFGLRWIFFLFFDLQQPFAFYCLWFKAVGYWLRWVFVYFLTSSVFLHFIAFGLMPSGLGSDGFFLLFDLQRSFAFYCLWFKAVGFKLPWIFFFF